MLDPVRLRRELQEKYFRMSDTLHRHIDAIGVVNEAAERFQRPGWGGGEDRPLHTCFYHSDGGVMRKGIAIWFVLKEGETMDDAAEIFEFLDARLPGKATHSDAVTAYGGSREVQWKHDGVEVALFIDVSSNSACKSVKVGTEDKYEFRCPGDPDYPEEA